MSQVGGGGGGPAGGWSGSCVVDRGSATSAASDEDAAEASAKGWGALCDLGRLDEAAASFREAQAVNLGAFGADHVQTATDSASVGLVFASQRKWKDAEAELEPAHRVLSRELEPTHPNLVAVGRFLAEARAAREGGLAEGGAPAAAGASPRVSPRVSPRASPRVSPHNSPRSRSPMLRVPSPKQAA